MHNWSTNEKALKKDRENYTAWKLEQLINFGLRDNKIKESELRRYFPKLNLDRHRKKFISLLLNERRSAH